MESKKNSPSSLPATVDEYIARFPTDVQEILQKIRSVVRETAPNAVEKISYQMPGYYLNGGLLWFGAYKNHIGMYPVGEDFEILKTELSAYKQSKGTIQFRYDQPIPYDLIRKIVEIRVAENLKKDF